MPSENIEDRVTALEVQVGELRVQVRAGLRDAAAARVLAGAADRDVEEIRGEVRDFRRATIAGFNAVRADISDMHQEMTGLRQEVRSKFDLTAAGQQKIVELLEGLIEGQSGTGPA
jgi:hypothetical protein